MNSHAFMLYFHLVFSSSEDSIHSGVYALVELRPGASYLSFVTERVNNTLNATHTCTYVQPAQHTGILSHRDI